MAPYPPWAVKAICRWQGAGDGPEIVRHDAAAHTHHWSQMVLPQAPAALIQIQCVTLSPVSMHVGYDCTMLSMSVAGSNFCQQEGPCAIKREGVFDGRCSELQAFKRCVTQIA